MLKVTAQFADGTLTWCTGPKTLADHTVPTLRAAAEQAGRDATRVAATLPAAGSLDGPRTRDHDAAVAGGHVGPVPQRVLRFIDFPQAVDIAANPQGIEFLHRDVLNVCGWFARRGYDIDADEVFADVLASL